LSNNTRGDIRKDDIGETETSWVDKRTCKLVPAFSRRGERQGHDTHNTQFLVLLS
jgi:hypothetical protein